MFSKCECLMTFLYRFISSVQQQIVHNHMKYKKPTKKCTRPISPLFFSYTYDEIYRTSFFLNCFRFAAHFFLYILRIFFRLFLNIMVATTRFVTLILEVFTTITFFLDQFCVCVSFDFEKIFFFLKFQLDFEFSTTRLSIYD